MDDIEAFLVGLGCAGVLLAGGLIVKGVYNSYMADDSQKNEICFGEEDSDYIVKCSEKELRKFLERKKLEVLEGKTKKMQKRFIEDLVKALDRRSRKFSDKADLAERAVARYLDRTSASLDQLKVHLDEFRCNKSVGGYLKGKGIKDEIVMLYEALDCGKENPQTFFRNKFEPGSDATAFEHYETLVFEKDKKNKMLEKSNKVIAEAAEAMNELSNAIHCEFEARRSAEIADKLKEEISKEGIMYFAGARKR